MLVFGPVPSRRLGRSLGINNIPPKICTYACIYCQVGRTTQLTTVRQKFYAPTDILDAVERKLEQARAANAAIDYLTFVPDGEPTLDLGLAQTIDRLRSLGHNMAVITNASLLWQAEVRAALQAADWVSLKVDGVSQTTWRKVNRPHGSLAVEKILAGIEAFAQSYAGHLVTETMLVRGVNDDAPGLQEVGAFLAQLRPVYAYLSVPTRPPAEGWVRAPDEATLHQAYQVFKTHLDRVEYLIHYEGSEFSVTSQVEEDLLNIVAVHPMREDAVLKFLARAGAATSVLDGLIEQGVLKRVAFAGHWFYVRNFSRVVED